MKVVFSCYIFDFHRDYCNNIAEEIIRRGGEVIFAKSGHDYHPAADFTIQPDEAYPRLGGRGVWINHAFPVVPQNNFYLGEKFKNQLRMNSDLIFTFSKEWSAWHSAMYGLETHVVGMPKLDNLFPNTKKSGLVLYAPTHHLKDGVYSGNNVDTSALKKLCFEAGYSDFVHRGHPAFERSDKTLSELFSQASLVITDYSSVGLESIVLRIPTILIGDPKWKTHKNDHISSLSDAAATRIYNLDDLPAAIQMYAQNPKHKSTERSSYSNRLCEFQGNSAKKMVDLLEELL